jgi:hypothetical protein
MENLKECHMLTVNFGAPNIFVTLWFELDYATNPPLGTLMILSVLRLAPKLTSEMCCD